MRGRKYTPEVVVKVLRDVERLHGQGKSVVEVWGAKSAGLYAARS